MLLNEENLLSTLELALQELVEKKDPSFVATLRSIIRTNLARGRIQSFLKDHENPTPRHYVLRVAEIYENLHPYLYELQTKRSNEVWQALYKRMYQRARRYFIYAGFPESKATQEIAEECAMEAAAQILTTYFPYDVDFAPWMYVLLRNVCHGALQKSTRVSEKDISELEELLTDSTIPFGRTLENSIDLRKAFFHILEKLPEARKQVILMHYFEGYSFSEIAEALGKTPNAVHQLHFYARRDLEKLLKEEG
ncbi:MAG TPA: RNA polymerase sigma factor [Anaerolineales bacterium]|nr:RNA polymerase sigma factor [Anaerolineales bacterium]